MRFILKNGDNSCLSLKSMAPQSIQQGRVKAIYFFFFLNHHQSTGETPLSSKIIKGYSWFLLGFRFGWICIGFGFVLLPIDSPPCYSPAMEVSQPNGNLYPDQLDVGVTGTIVVMICRVWDVNATTGCYLSTEFIVSDARGNAMHFTARSSIAQYFVKLKDGVVYSIKNFDVKPNKEQYCIRREDAFMLEFDESTTSRKASVKSDGFDRYQFKLEEIENIEPTNGNYLIDVAGYVTNVGRTITHKSGSRIIFFLDLFHDSLDSFTSDIISQHNLIN